MKDIDPVDVSLSVLFRRSSKTSSKEARFIIATLSCIARSVLVQTQNGFPVSCCDSSTARQWERLEFDKSVHNAEFYRLSPACFDILRILCT